MLGRNQAVARRLIDDIVALGSGPSDSIRLFTSAWGYWTCEDVLRPRKLNTVVLPQFVAEEILEDAKDFLSSAEWYRNVGIPWHHGVLLEGPPGTGKTSAACALAGELGMDLYLLSLSSGMNDERLFNLMSQVRPGTMILMEDVDCYFPNREAAGSTNSRVTLSGLLNCLDGVQSREGCMIFMTTNRAETLDPALLRPGRVDLRVSFGMATDEQILRLRDHLNSSVLDCEILSVGRGKTMAEVQRFLLDSLKTAKPNKLAITA